MGTEENVSILEVAEMFKHPYMIVPERRGERLSSTVLTSRAQTELGWAPKWKLQDYIENCILINEVK